MIIVLIAVGLVVLVLLSIAVGTSLDTSTQRREWRRLADERRARPERFRARAEPDRTELCEDCPLRYW
jgi:hypothetical protein